MFENLKKLEQEIKEKLFSIKDSKSLSSLKVDIFGKKGSITNYLKSISSLPDDQKKEAGQTINELKNKINTMIEKKFNDFNRDEIKNKLFNESIDSTLSSRPDEEGKINPITQTIAEVTKIFQKMGFKTVLGPDIEDDYHNFTALNIPPEHPARQLHDTFYLKKNKNDQKNLLRTHTSPVQIRILENTKPPLKIIAPGRTYRADSDITHTPMFHQIEGLYIDKNVNMSHLKGCILDFCREYFDIEDLPVRFRPSFFSFY